jgi:hypothetical protein
MQGCCEAGCSLAVQQNREDPPGEVGPNHGDNNRLRINAVELFGASVAGLPDDVLKFCFPAAPIFLFRWVLLHGVISCLSAKCDGDAHDRSALKINATRASPGSP